MFRVLIPGVFGLVALALWIYCIFDVIATEESLVRNMPKTLWLIIVIFLPTVGSIAWLALGRPLYAGLRPGDTNYRPPRRVMGPDDDPTFGRSSHAPSSDEADRLRIWEADLRRREDELKKGNDPAKKPPEDDPPPPFPHTW